MKIMGGFIAASSLLLLVACGSASSGSGASIPDKQSTAQRPAVSVTLSKDTLRPDAVVETPNPFISFPSDNPPNLTFQGYITVYDSSGGVELINYSCSSYLTVTGGTGGTEEEYSIYSKYASFTGPQRNCDLEAYGNSGHEFVTVNLNGSY